jgi:hypothetical protein
MLWHAYNRRFLQAHTSNDESVAPAVSLLCELLLLMILQHHSPSGEIDGGAKYCKLVPTTGAEWCCTFLPLYLHLSWCVPRLCYIWHKNLRQQVCMAGVVTVCLLHSAADALAGCIHLHTLALLLLLLLLLHFGLQ